MNKEEKVKMVNPATEEVLRIPDYDQTTAAKLQGKKSTKRIDEWEKDASKRINLLHDFANQLGKDKERLARTATNEMGKVIKESRSEVENVLG